MEDDELSDEPVFRTVEDLCADVFLPPEVDVDLVDDLRVEYVALLSAGVGVSAELRFDPLASPTIGRPV